MSNNSECSVSEESSVEDVDDVPGPDYHYYEILTEKPEFLYWDEAPIRKLTEYNRYIFQC